MRAPKTGKGVAWEAWAIDTVVNRLGQFATVDEARAAVENHLEKAEA